MAEQTYLKVTLKLMALYAGLMGAMMLLFHEAASFLFQHPVADPMVTRYWGGVLLAIAIFYLFLSTDPAKYRLFIWVGVFDLGAAMILTIVSIAQKNIMWIQGITGLVLNPAFIIMLLYGLAKEPEGKVVFTTGGNTKRAEGQELPPHITGKHPLQGK
jgi:ABC-type Fe3+-siderophore transport system permease subunit